MNVSITEDATIKRTRFGGGATVVRVEAIAWNFCCYYRYLGYEESEKLCRPPESLSSEFKPVNEKSMVRNITRQGKDKDCDKRGIAAGSKVTRH